MEMANTVILGWGSLIWNPRGLPIKGDWQKGGPTLRLEFSRISRDCRLTLVVIDEPQGNEDELQGSQVVVRYARSPRNDMKDTICDLLCREETVLKNIGFLDLSNHADSKHGSYSETIKTWARAKGVSAVVWTALPSNFLEQIGKKFSVPVAVDFFSSLPASAKKSAAEYFEKAPEEVDTPLLRRMVELGFIMRTAS